MKKIKIILVLGALIIGVGALLLPSTHVGAVNAISDACKVNPNSTICTSNNGTTESVIKTVVNTLLYIVGIVSVVVVIIGGFMYTLSSGDSANVTKAKNTIVYALVGLVIAFLAYAIVNWVLGVFGPSAAQQNCEKAGGTYNTTTSICKAKP